MASHNKDAHNVHGMCREIETRGGGFGSKIRLPFFGGKRSFQLEFEAGSRGIGESILGSTSRVIMGRFKRVNGMIENPRLSNCFSPGIENRLPDGGLENWSNDGCS